MQIGNERTPQSVVAQLNEIAGGLRRLTKNDTFAPPLGLPREAFEVYEGDATVSGVEINGSTVFKIFHADGAWVNVQITLPNGEVLYLPNAQFEGCFIRIGKASGTLLVTEDLHDGLALNIATNQRVAVAMHAANVSAVCRALSALRARRPNRKMIVCSRGHGWALELVTAAAIKIDAPLASPSPAISFAELFNAEGVDGVAEAIDAAAPADDEGFPLDEKAVEVVPWLHPVNGQALITDIRNLIDDHVSVTRASTLVIALHSLFTYTVSAASVAPILAINSEHKVSGKTILMSLLARIAYQPKFSPTLPTADMFIETEKSRPTVLLDDAHTYLHKSTELTGIITAGYARDTAFVLRAPKGKPLAKYSTFGGTIIAMLGGLPDPIHDRSIVIKMKRKLVTERKMKLAERSDVEIAALVGRIARFAADNLAQIRDAKFAPLDVGNDRLADVWHPLLSIASVIGNQALEEAKRAAKSTAGNGLTDSAGPEALLRAIKAIFERTERTKLASVKLIEELCSDEEAPWLNYSRGKHITTQAVSKLLRTFEIASKNIRPEDDDQVLKGYEREQFEDAFARYLPEAPM